MGKVHHYVNNIECIPVGSIVRLYAGVIMGRRRKIIEQFQIQVCYKVQETHLT